MNRQAIARVDLDVDHHEDNDAALIGRIILGDAQAAGVLVDRHTPALRRFLLRSGVRVENLDDLLQDIWIRVVRSASRYDPAQPFPPWLFAIAMNRLRTRWSREKPVEPLEAAPELVSPLPAADIALEGTERAGVVRAEIAKLPPHLGDAILLRYFEELSEQEMARRLGIPRGTVKSRLHAAMKRLRDGLEGILYA